MNAAAEFDELHERIKQYTMVGPERLKSLYVNAVAVCRDGVPGDFVECGVWRGGAAALLAVAVKRHTQSPRTVWACDSFEGLPEPTAADTHDGVPAVQCGHGAGGLGMPMDRGLSLVADLLEVQDILVPVKGFFRETLPDLAGRLSAIALLHADGDFYDSTMCILENLYGLVVPGGFVQIDDYVHWEGCRQAVDDFQRSHGLEFEMQRIDETGHCFRKGER